MRSEWIKKAAAALLATLLLELIPCQFSFWTTVTKNRGSDCAGGNSRGLYGDRGAGSGRGERRCGNARRSDNGEGGSALYLLDGNYLDDAGYLHVPDGSLTLRVKNYKGSLQRIFLNLVFAQSACSGRGICTGRGKQLSLYPGRQANFAAVGSGKSVFKGVSVWTGVGFLYPHPDGGRLWKCCRRKLWRLVVKYQGLTANGTIPFHFRAGRFVV